MSEAFFEYIGNELELFAAAKNWKNYITKLISPYIKGHVLEAGAGIGSNTLLLINPAVTSWLLLEPDKKFAGTLNNLLQEKKLPSVCSVFNGYTADLNQKFDTIIYIDVIEHIEDDKKEIDIAAGLLNKDGKLIVLSPAYNNLMSPFDKAIGHYRRYSKKTLLNLSSDTLIIEKIIFADSTGMIASFVNKYFLKQSYPTKKQIAFWDAVLVPISKVVDNILFHKTGKTIIAIWNKK